MKFSKMNVGGVRFASTEKAQKSLLRLASLEQQSVPEQFVNFLMKDGKKGLLLGFIYYSLSANNILHNLILDNRSAGSNLELIRKV